MTNSNEFIFPVTPSPYDERDYLWEHHHTPVATRSRRSLSRSTLPTTLNLTPYLPLPRNQGSRGTCVAFACAAIKEYQERLDTNYRYYMSPDSIYFYRSIKPEPGMYLRDAMKILAQQGISREDFFPYNSFQEPKSVPEKALADMPNWKIKEYARITTLTGLKEALVSQGPCLIAFPVYDVRPQFWRASSKDVPMNGGHAVAVVGYNKEGFLLRNSWGHDWNNDGLVVYPYNEWGKHWEVWSCLDEESLHLFPKFQTINWLKLCPCLKQE